MLKPPFQLRERRDFGQLISGSFALLRQHGRPLYRAIGISCLPPLLFAAYLIGGGFSEITSNVGKGIVGGEDRAVYGGFMIAAAYGLFALLFVYLHALVHEFLRALDRRETQAITTAILVTCAVTRIFHYAGILIITGLMVAASTIVFILLFTLNEPVITVVSAIAMMAAVFAVFTYASLASASQAMERNGVTTSLQRSFKLVSGDFWPTLGVSMVMGLIVGAMGYIVQLLGMLVMMLLMFVGASGDNEAMNTLMPIIMALFFGLQFAVMLGTYPLPCTCLTLKLCSRIEEQEGHGLRSRIESFETM
ncbi:MAG: hypothetical protein WAT74_15050 [Flavobacteriales bacterium]